MFCIPWEAGKVQRDPEITVGIDDTGNIFIPLLQCFKLRGPKHEV